MSTFFQSTMIEIMSDPIGFWSAGRFIYSIVSSYPESIDAHCSDGCRWISDHEAAMVLKSANLEPRPVKTWHALSGGEAHLFVENSSWSYEDSIPSLGQEQPFMALLLHRISERGPARPVILHADIPSPMIPGNRLEIDWRGGPAMVVSR